MNAKPKEMIMLNGVMVLGYEVREEALTQIELAPAPRDDEADWLLGAEAWVPLQAVTQATAALFRGGVK